ncbi:hypothetical protein [Marivirga sp.]|uniref:hypothetical protein n=1 Tax=Marivirga sp. TaxID=2018662 RepID=UPI0025EC9FC9|nr:hypothetical protein [Marivirga sp.]
MKILLIPFFLLFGDFAIGQVPPYEQIAFDYYRNVILDDDKPDKKFTLWTELHRQFDIFHYPRCLDFKLTNVDSLNLNASGLTHLELKNDKRFKIKPTHKGAFPRVYSQLSYHTTNDQHIVAIIEIHKNQGIVYYIEMKNSGDVTNWCKGGWIE